MVGPSVQCPFLSCNILDTDTRRWYWKAISMPTPPPLLAVGRWGGRSMSMGLPSRERCLEACLSFSRKRGLDDRAAVHADLRYDLLWRDTAHQQENRRAIRLHLFAEV